MRQLQIMWSSLWAHVNLLLKFGVKWFYKIAYSWNVLTIKLNAFFRKVHLLMLHLSIYKGLLILLILFYSLSVKTLPNVVGELKENIWKRLYLQSRQYASTQCGSAYNKYGSHNIIFRNYNSAVEMLVCFSPDGLLQSNVTLWMHKTPQ